MTASVMAYYDERATVIAVSLLKLRDLKPIQLLKDLLTFIPNPGHIRAILTHAVVKVVDDDPQSALWLFQHLDVLEPEIQVKAVIVQALTQKLYALGYTSHDVRVTDDYHLNFSEAAIHILRSQSDPDQEDVITLIQALSSSQ